MATVGAPAPELSSIGASLDGMSESISLAGEPSGEIGSRVDWVVLPEGRGDPILARGASQRSRLALGLPWPPEARIEANSELHRVPVAALWRGLVQARDGKATWRSGYAVESFADLLAAHIVAAFEPAQQNQEIVLGVPDALSDFAQQRLLDALKHLGWRNFRLLWNPIALALRWLDAVGDRLRLEAEGNSLIVFHIGAGAVDCATFELRNHSSAGGSLIVPIRQPGRLVSRFSGLDLAISRLVHSAREAGAPLDIRALWYGLNLRGLARRGPEGQPPREIWHRSDRWETVPPSVSLTDAPPDLATALPKGLEELLEAHGMPGRRGPAASDWETILRTTLDFARTQAKGRPSGVILSGSPLGCDRWARIAEYACSPLRCTDVPSPDSIWQVPEAGKAISQGARIFGDRLQLDLPTYLETLPRFEVYAQTAEGARWEPLVESTETEGGRPYEKTIPDKFALGEGQDALEAYLRLRDGDSPPIKRTRFSFPRGPKRKMPLKMKVEMRPAGGLAIVEMVPEDPGFLGGVQVYLDYREMTEVNESELPQPMLYCPPVKPPHYVDDADSLIFEAGLAQAIRIYLDTGVRSPSYSSCLTTLRQAVTRTTLRDERRESRKIVVRPIDLDGRAATEEGQSLIDQLSFRIGEDFEAANRAPRPAARSKLKDQLLITGAWLFGAAPEQIRDHVVTTLREQPVSPGRNVINAAGRILNTKEEIQVFFQSMQSAAWAREDQGDKRGFAIDWLWSAKRLLMGREVAAHALDHRQTTEFYRFLFNDLQSWIRAGGNGFGAALLLLFYLFRYRRVERKFLSSDSTKDADLRSELEESIRVARRQLSRAEHFTHRRRELGREVLNGLKKFLDYQGSMNIVEMLSEFDEGS